MRLFIFCMRMKGFGAYMNVVLQPNKTKTKARIPLAVSKNDLAELLLLRFQRQHWSVCVLALKMTHKSYSSILQGWHEVHILLRF